MGSSIAMSSGSRWRFWFLVFSLFSFGLDGECWGLHHGETAFRMALG